MAACPGQLIVNLSLRIGAPRPNLGQFVLLCYCIPVYTFTHLLMGEYGWLTSMSGPDPIFFCLFVDMPFLRPRCHHA